MEEKEVLRFAKGSWSLYPLLKVTPHESNGVDPLSLSVFTKREEKEEENILCIFLRELPSLPSFRCRRSLVRAHLVGTRCSSDKSEEEEEEEGKDET